VNAAVDTDVVVVVVAAAVAVVVVAAAADVVVAVAAQHESVEEPVTVHPLDNGMFNPILEENTYL